MWILDNGYLRITTDITPDRFDRFTFTIGIHIKEWVGGSMSGILEVRGSINKFGQAKCHNVYTRNPHEPQETKISLPIYYIGQLVNYSRYSVLQNNSSASAGARLQGCSNV